MSLPDSPTAALDASPFSTYCPSTRSYRTSNGRCCLGRATSRRFGQPLAAHLMITDQAADMSGATAIGHHAGSARKSPEKTTDGVTRCGDQQQTLRALERDDAVCVHGTKR